MNTSFIGHRVLFTRRVESPGILRCRLGAAKGNRRKTSVPVWLALAIGAFGMAASTSLGSTLVQEFYLPMPEAQIYQANSAIIGGTSSTSLSTFSIVVTGNGTTIYYDQWEDGYEVNLGSPIQPTTQIWGDGNDANGIPPGFAHDPAGLIAGTIITLTNSVSLPRNPSTILWDGRDRIAATKALVISRAAWPVTPGPVFAGAVGVLSTLDYGTNYISPVGQDLTNNLFKYVGMFVMAAQNNTTVTIDPNGNGVGTTTVVLNQGESYLVNGGIKKGGRITASKPVQADLIIGHVGASYASDWFTLYPVESWSSSYYTPVGSARNGNPAYVYLFNPNTNALTINYNTQAGSGSFSLPASNGVFQFQMPVASGASFVNAAGQHFFAVCTVGANNASDTAFNWGFTLVPKEALTTEAVVGWGPGSADLTVNGSPVWVTPLANTRIYVDYKGDRTGPLTDPNGSHYDTNYNLVALQSKTIFDPSRNQTGMRVYTVDGTLITAAWGEDPDVASPGNPYIDAGTTVLPFPVPVLHKTAVIVNDSLPNGLSVGDTIEYTVQVDNKGLLPLGNLVIFDAPSSNMTYVANSTTLDGTPLPDNVTGTPFPMDAPGYVIPLILRAGTSTFKYRYLVVSSGVVSNSVNIGGTTISSSTTLLPQPTNGASCGLAFTSAGGSPVTFYAAGAAIFVSMTNAAGNTSSNSVQTLTVTVNNLTHGDVETIVLTETGANTGVFFSSGGLPSSATAGLGQQDGTLSVTAGDMLSVAYTDPIFSDTCNALATIQAAAKTKVLYLSTNGSTNSVQALDRVDPVAAGHITPAQSVELGGSGPGTIAVDAVSSGSTNGTVLTLSHTTGPGASRLMLIGVSTDNQIAPSSVTYNGVGLTSIGSSIGQAPERPRVEIFSLVAPPSGTFNVVVTLGSSANAIVGVTTFTGVNQSTSLGTFVGAFANGAPTVSVSSAANELVFDTVGSSSGGGLVVGAGQSQRWNLQQTIYGGGSTKPGAASVTMSWTSTAKWAMGAVPIKPASSGGGTNLTTFTQTPVFCQNFAMPSNGVVTITNYATITSGSMPANPNITATLKYGINSIITLSNPAYNGGVGALSWSGTLATNVTVPSGQAVDLVISNAQAAVSFTLAYDSIAQPSKILLPTTSVIHIGSLGVYDAPYPGGSLVTAPVAGSTLYVRTVVSDPFGGYDITSVNLAITAPTPSANVNATLTDPSLVASNGCSKTYEYTWQTGPATGGYNLAATANEGTEGITDIAGAGVTLIFLDLGTPSTTEFTSGNNGPATNSFAANAVACIRVTDLDQNANAAIAETLTTIVTSSSGDSELVTLTEIGTNTGIFTACLNTSTGSGAGGNNGLLLAPVGSVLTLSYTDPNDPSDQSSASGTIQPPPGVPGVTMNKTLITPSGGQVGTGQPVMFNLQVVNTGSTTLTNVIVTDNFPSAKLSYSSATVAPSTVSAGVLTWTNLGAMTPGQSTNFTVTFTTLATGTATNSATANGGTATNLSATTVLITHATLNVTKTLLSPTNTPVLVGSNVTFRITIQNVGDTIIPTLPLEDTFSGAFYQFVSATIPPDGMGAGSLLWTNLANPTPLAINATITMDVIMKVIGQGNPANNTATADFAVDTFGNPVPAASSTIGVTTAASQINGHVYNDKDQSGTLTAGDVGLDSVTLQLFTDPNGDGNPADGTLVQMTATDGNGYYELLNLKTGRYVVVETDLAGYASVAPANNRLAINLTSFTASTNNNFFDYQPSAVLYSTLSGVVWNDANGNGTNDVGETGLANVTVDLVQDLNTNGIFDLGEPVAASVSTDAGGNYTFAGVTPGSYLIHETDPYGYDSTGDSQPPNDNLIALTLSGGVVSSTNNFFDHSNQPPVANDDNASTPKNVSVTIAPLANDSDPDGNSLSILSVSPTNGTATFTTTNIVFTPAANFVGLATIGYTISDGFGGTATALITVNVTNRPPVANNDTVATPEDTVLIFDPRVNDTDPDGDALTIIGATATNGTVTIAGGTNLVFTPATNFSGTVTVSYTITDGNGATASAAITITVTPVNDAPLALNQNVITPEDTATNLVLSATDLDSTNLVFAVVVGPTNGGLSLLNTNTGAVTYAPATNYNGLDSFTFSVFDGNLYATGMVSITVTPVNDAPVANNQIVTTPEDAATNLFLTATDVDSTNLTYGILAGPTNGTISAFNPSSGALTYRPGTNYSGPDSVTFTVSDGSLLSTGMVSITVTPVNDAPVASNDSFSLFKNTTLVLPAGGVLTNDSDVDGDTLTALVVTGPAHAAAFTLNPNGGFTYTPASNYFGPDSFTYRASDGLTNSGVATVNLTIVAANTAPVAVNDSFIVNEDTTLVVPAGGVLTNDIDADGDTLTALLATGPAHAGAFSLNPNGGFTYTPVTNYSGLDSFTYRVSDGLTNSGIATASITVNPVNDAPLANDQSATTAEDTATNLVLTATDVDSTNLTYAILAGPTNGTIIGFNTNTGTLAYQPNTNYNGPDTLTFTVSDGSLYATGTVSITVTPVNDPPLASNDNYTLGKNTSLTIAAPGVLGNDSDVDGDTLTAVKVTDPAHGVVILNANGGFTYTPASNYFGVDSFTYQANDGAASSAIVTVGLTITNINRAPVASPDTYALGKNGSLTIAGPGVLGNDTDLDGDALTAVKLTDPAHGVLNLNANGGFSYTPASNYFGADSFTYQASDGVASSASATVSLTITNINRAPVVIGDSYTLGKNGSLTIAGPGVLGNDTDLDGDALTAVKIADPSHGVLNLNANGGFTYTPASNYFGADSFNYQASDGIASSASAVVSLTITNLNRAPVATADSYTLGKNGALTIAGPGVLGNDTDADGDTLTAVKLTDPTHGIVSLNANGGFTYTPASNYFGADSFTYEANDGVASSPTTTVSLAITNLNRAPVAIGDSYTLGKNGSLTIAGPGVLANDTDLDGDALTAVKLTDPLHGILNLNTNGGFTYTPASNYFGADSFTYQANDGVASSSSAIVSLTITNINRAPVATADSYALGKNGSLTIAGPGVLANDTDLDGDALTAAKITDPSHGIVSLNSNGGFAYTPVSNYFGADSFTYQASDGVASSTSTIVNLTITNINRAPVATGDSYTLGKNGSLTIAGPGVLSNDTDLDGDPLTAVKITDPAHGVISLNANGGFTYTPVSNYFGADSFTYQANDGIASSASATVSLTITNINRAPVATGDSYTLGKNGSLTIAGPGVLGNDTDLDGDTLTAVKITDPAHGALILNANGGFIYTPVSNYFGADSFTYQASDGVASSASATVSLAITNINRAPVATADSYTLGKNGSLTVAGPGVLINDTDLDGDALTAAKITDPAHGIVTLNANGGFTYTPASNYSGADSFTYQANDGVAGSSSAAVSLTITNLNRAPVAAADSYVFGKNGSPTIAGPGVLGNDTDLDGDALTAVKITDPAHGVVNLNSNGGFTYTPASNYFGADSFTYQANDGIASSPAATVSLTITNLNRAPVANADSYTLGKNGSLAIAGPGVLGNDSDLDGDALTAVKITDPLHGILNLNTNGGFTYTPASNYFGADSFTYQANDGVASSTSATVSFTITNINRAPVATGDSYTLGKNGTLTIAGPGLLGNDSDLDGDALTAIKITDPVHGILNLNTNGGFTYTPVSNYFGADSFTYQASDGVASSVSATVSLTITNINRAPVATADSYTLGKNGSLTVAGPGVLGNDTDLDGDAVTAVKITDPAHGILNLNTNGGFTYTPASNYFGADNFTYQASDGAASSATATVSLTITNINRAPAASADSYTLGKNGSLTIAGPGLLGNDTDLDGDALTAVKITDPSHGLVTLNSNGGFTYAPVSNYFGADSFTYQANDGVASSPGATVSLTITNINRAPVANTDSYTLGKNGSLTVAGPGMLGNDTDLDGDAVTAVKITDPAHGILNLNTNGGFTYTPASNYFGADSFTYQASDGAASSATATVSLTITNINRAPVASADSYTLGKNGSLTIVGPGVLGNDSDLDGDALTAIKITDPSHGIVSLNSNGGFTYTPVSNYFGADSFTYQASDGVASSTSTIVNLTITNINRAPVATGDSYTLGKNGSLTIAGPGVLGNDTDLDGDTLTAAKITDPAHGLLNLNTNGGFTYTPASNYFGADSFTYQASDGAASSATATVSLTITNINRTPVASADSYTLGKNGSLTIAGPGVLGNDTDLDGDVLTAAKMTDPAHGIVSLNANGGFTYTPGSNYFGADSFTYQASDGIATSTSAIVSLTITNLNRAPVANAESYTLGKNGSFTIAGPGVLGNDTDADGDTLTAVKLTDPTHGIVNLNANGGFTYTPASNYSGSDSFTYQANDGAAGSASATVSLTITNINRAPVANNDSYGLNKSASLTVSGPGVLGNDTDADGDALTAIKITDPAHGSLNLNVNGAFTYTPVSNYFGADNFTYRASDGLATSAVATVSLTITNVNHAPVLGNDSFTNSENIPFSLPLATLLTNDYDPDGDPLTITLVSTNSAQNGRITTTATNLTYTPPTNYVGTDTFIYVVNDGHGGSSTGTVFILLALPQFGILAGPTVLNPQTGLFEQNVTVTNIGATTVAAVRLSVVGLRTNVALYNATGTNAGLPYVQYNSPLNPGQNVKFVLEYYVPDRRPLTNTFIVEEVLPAATGTNSAVGVPIDKEFMDLRIPGGTRFVIEFTSIPGRTYTILYSGNLTTWNAATPAITANATKTQWYDDGPPKTDSPPLSVTNRFYRVLVAPANP